jgi:hypothetical protein
MNLKLNTFNKEMTKDERKAASIVQDIRLEGPLANDKELTKAFLDIMEYIYSNYEMDRECVFRLKDETCNCGKKLTKKGEYEKEITLPGGSSLFLKFYRYSCSHCKKPIDRKLSEIFEPNKQYSKNVKSDAIRLYSKHLSNYRLIAEELSKLYRREINHKTVRLWLNEAGIESERVTLNDNDFSGYLVYDEEFMKVFFGDVGIKGAKLEWVQVYLLLFRDVITKKCIIRIVENLEEETLLKEWIAVIKHLQSLGIQVKTMGTDGKREYHNFVTKINRMLGTNIEHVYDAFHFMKNLYESANEELFGNKYSKKELPENVLNTIKIIKAFFDVKSKEEAEKYLKDTLLFQKNTFLKSLQHHILRLKKYFNDYTKFIEIPQMKTTSLCESWFHQTKPEKLKKGYKTMNGLKAIANMITVRINYDWQKELQCKFDFSLALDGLLGVLKAKFQGMR